MSPIWNRYKKKILNFKRDFNFLFSCFLDVEEGKKENASNKQIWHPFFWATTLAWKQMTGNKVGKLTVLEPWGRQTADMAAASFAVILGLDNYPLQLTWCSAVIDQWPVGLEQSPFGTCSDQCWLPAYTGPRWEQFSEAWGVRQAAFEGTEFSEHLLPWPY